MTHSESSIGVLLVNLGTPKSSSHWHVYRYLTEFLTDPRVIDFPWLKRQALVRGIIIPFRLRQSTNQYRQVWTDKGSPLLFHSLSLEEKLQESMGSKFKVVLAMRYQHPSIEEGLEKLKNAGVDQIIVVPLFPQYASATTGSVHQKVMDIVSSWGIIPKFTFINHYCNHEGLINAFCARAKEQELSQYDHYLFSFHGLPERHIRKESPDGSCLTASCCQTFNSKNKFCYKAQCYATARAIIERLNLPEDQCSVCFQSRLGKEPWLSPYTSDVLHQLAKNGTKNLLVFSPAFVSDCLETIFEIGQEYAGEFTSSGGENLNLVTGLNDHPTWIAGLSQIIKEQLT